MHIQQLLGGRPSGAQHGIEQIGEAVRFADDHAGVFAQRRVEQLPFEQLRRTAQAAERILDLVGELPDHQAAAPQLGEQRVLARQAPVLGDVLDLEQQPRVILADRDLGDGAIEDAVEPNA